MKSILFVLILGLTLFVTEARSQVVKPVPAGIVYADGTAFKVSDVNGVATPFYFTGTNNYYLMYKPTTMVNDVLDGMVSMGMKVVRMWFFMDGPGRDGVPYLQTAAGVYNEVAYVEIDKVVAAAAERGLRIIPAFVNYWTDFGGMAQYATWAGAQATDFFTNASMKQTYKNYVSSWINRTNTVTGVKYKEDPTIFAWQLTNEARCLNNKSADVVAWANEMSTHIRSLDPHHMICMGDEGILNYTNAYCDSKGLYKNFAYSGGQGDWVGLLNLKNIDFGTLHSYWVDQWAIYDKTTKLVENTAVGVEWIDIHVEEATKIGKPCILEEYNKADVGLWSDLNDTNRSYVMDEYQKAIRGEGYSPYLKAQRTQAMAGDLSWMLTGLNYVDSVPAGYTLDVNSTTDVGKYWLYRVLWGSDGHSYSMYDPKASAIIKAHAKKMSDKNVVALPTSFTQLSPSSTATNVSINAFLNWQVSSNATSYTVVVADNAAFNNPIITKTSVVPTTLKVTGLSYSTTYFWKVTAINILGAKVASNAGTTFTTQAPPPAVGSFSLVSPVGKNIANKATNFSWTAGANADYYQLVVSTKADLSTPIINVTDINSLSYTSTVTLLEGTTYYYQVTGVNSLHTKVSAVGSFVSQLPSAAIDMFESYSSCATVTAAWVRNTGGAALEVCTESVIGVTQGSKSMRMSYNFSQGGYCGVMKALGGQSFLGYEGINVDITGDNSGNDFTMQIRETSGEYWELTLPINFSSTTTVKYNFSSFKVKDHGAVNRILDLASIAEISIYFGKNGGTNTVYVDNLRLAPYPSTPTTVNSIVNTNSKLTLYPNPAGKEVTVMLSDDMDKKGLVRIYSISGFLVYSQVYDLGITNALTIELSSLDFRSGIYLLDVNGQVARLVVK